MAAFASVTVAVSVAMVADPTCASIGVSVVVVAETCPDKAARGLITCLAGWGALGLTGLPSTVLPTTGLPMTGFVTSVTGAGALRWAGKSPGIVACGDTGRGFSTETTVSVICAWLALVPPVKF